MVSSPCLPYKTHPVSEKNKKISDVHIQKIKKIFVSPDTCDVNYKYIFTIWAPFVFPKHVDTIRMLIYSEGMLDEFAVHVMKTLMSEMSAATADGMPDHKTRIQALKEARAFVKDLLPRLNSEDRDKFSKAMSQEMENKLNLIQIEEEKLERLHAPPSISS